METEGKRGKKENIIHLYDREVERGKKTNST